MKATAPERSTARNGPDLSGAFFVQKISVQKIPWTESVRTGRAGEAPPQNHRENSGESLRRARGITGGTYTGRGDGIDGGSHAGSWRQHAEQPRRGVFARADLSPYFELRSPPYNPPTLRRMLSAILQNSPAHTTGTASSQLGRPATAPPPRHSPPTPPQPQPDSPHHRHTGGRPPAPAPHHSPPPAGPARQPGAAHRRSALPPPGPAAGSGAGRYSRRGC